MQRKKGEKDRRGEGYEKESVTRDESGCGGEGARPELERDTTEKKHSVSKTGHNHVKHTTSRGGDANQHDGHREDGHTWDTTQQTAGQTMG